jgi:hypothetical protein
MKTTFKIFGLKEQQIIRSSWLSSDGIENETELSVTRHHITDFDNEFEAMEFISKTQCEFEHGFEIIKTFRNN